MCAPIPERMQGYSRRDVQAGEVLRPDSADRGSACRERNGQGERDVKERCSGVHLAQGCQGPRNPHSSKSYLKAENDPLGCTRVSEGGKEAVVAVLGPGDFFGEGCLAGQLVCMATASAIVPTSILSIERNEMMRVLRTEHAFSDRFISHMLTRNIRVKEDFIDQLFNSSEKRLARALLLLARDGKEDQSHGVLPKVSQETLAEMIGTTRSRVNFFMNKFRKLGFIRYNGGVEVNTALLSVVLPRVREKK
jgi:CRP/FNR family cyclic AMP-dependent transcriptional regulator